MNNEYDKEKIIECMFEPVTSEILAELENGAKNSFYLVEKLQISETNIRNKLSYLIEHEFVKEEIKNNEKIYEANAGKLGKVLENDSNFENVVDGLTEMDSYLN